MVALAQLWLYRGLINCFRTFTVKMQLNTCCQLVTIANRAQNLTESTLLIKLQQIALSENAESTNNVNLEVIQKLYKTVFSKEAAVDLNIPEMQALRAVLKSTKITLQESLELQGYGYSIENILKHVEPLSEHPELAIGSCIYLPSVK